MKLAILWRSATVVAGATAIALASAGAALARSLPRRIGQRTHLAYRGHGQAAGALRSAPIRSLGFCHAMP